MGESDGDRAGKILDRWRWEIYMMRLMLWVRAQDGREGGRKKKINKNGVESGSTTVCGLTSCRRSEEERENIFWTEAEGGRARLVS